MDEAESARFMEGVFAADLDGHALITNRSLWRSFPMIRSGSYVMGNVVLLGTPRPPRISPSAPAPSSPWKTPSPCSSASTAHADVPSALAHFEATRREEVEKTQHAADVSLVWFEQVRRFWAMDPVQFAFGVMTRSKSITYDNLRLRAPEFVAETDRMFASQVRAAGFDVDEQRPLPPMFQPLRLRGMTLANRVVVSPMCMYSAQDGVPNDWHLVHYGARASGGAGLVFTEMTDVSAEARITPGCAGIYTDEQEAAWARITAFVHARSQARMCLQLGHAGRKGATRLMWEGMDRPLPTGGWEIVAPSPLPYYPDSPVPRAMTRRDMDRVVADFAQAAHPRRARRVRHAGTALRPRLPARHLPVPAHQPPRRRIRRLAGEPPPLPARSVGRRPRRLARRTSRCPSASPPPTGPRAASPPPRPWPSPKPSPPMAPT